ncbi:MAG: hypothetical protein AAGF46_04240 [Pseudomonadota bacterium]
MQPMGFNSEVVSEVCSLNQAFIKTMLSAAAAGRMALEPRLQEALQSAHEAATGSVGRCPFLLYRLEFPPPAVHEHAASSLGGGRGDSDGATSLASMTLAFLWQLARSDMAAARIVAGASVTWCQDLAGRPLAELAPLARQAVLTPRLIDVPGYWRDLTRERGISALQRASLGAAGLQMLMSQSRQQRLPAQLPAAPESHWLDD